MRLNIYNIEFDTLDWGRGYATAAALSSRQAFDVLKASGRFNAFPRQYKLVSAVLTDGSCEFDSPYLISEVVTKIALMKGDKGDKGDPGGVATKEDIINVLGYTPADNNDIYVVKKSGLGLEIKDSGSTGTAEKSFAQGSKTKATGFASHSEGTQTQATSNNAHSEGQSSNAVGSNSHAEGNSTNANATGSHSEGYSTSANGKYSHAEGKNTVAGGEDSHSEGQETTASAIGSHAEGNKTTASGNNSHSEGDSTIASKATSHAEGGGTVASQARAHAEGTQTTASGYGAHAEGALSAAAGYASHAEGHGTVTTSGNSGEHAEGQYNRSSHDNNTFGNRLNTIHSIGIGTGEDDRKNAFEIMQNGDVYVYGFGDYDGTNAGTAKTLLAAIANRLGAIEYVTLGDLCPSLPSSYIIVDSYAKILSVTSSGTVGVLYEYQNGWRKITGDYAFPEGNTYGDFLAWANEHSVAVGSGGGGGDVPEGVLSGDILEGTVPSVSAPFVEYVEMVLNENQKAVVRRNIDVYSKQETDNKVDTTIGNINALLATI